MYFESHAHYDDPRFDEDRDELINSLKNNGVDYIINIGADMESSEKSIDLANKYDFIYATVGVHPHSAKSLNEDKLKELEKMTENKKVVGIGEIGLDYYYDNSPRDTQKYWFIKQLEMARKLDLPVVIHTRDAAQETFDIISESNISKGVIHAYSGSREMAEEYIKMGFLIGVGGVITFKNARRLLETVEYIPLSSILIETDAPYLTPHPHRGKRNDSQKLEYIVDKIAHIKQISPDEVAKTTMENGLKLFLKN